MAKPNTRPGAAGRGWTRPFLAALGETSNVARAAKAAGVCTSTVYDTRRKNRTFARAWGEALSEGYDNLEMELLGRLREGEIKRAQGAKVGVRTFDNATSFRLLAVHREAVERHKGHRANVSAAEVRASIERKVTALKAQVLARENVDREGESNGE